MFDLTVLDETLCKMQSQLVHLGVDGFVLHKEGVKGISTKE